MQGDSSIGRVIGFDPIGCEFDPHSPCQTYSIMQPITIFDLVSDKVCWLGDCCGGCGETLPKREHINNQEVIMRMYLNSDDKIVCILYHAECWNHSMNVLKKLGGSFV